MTFKMLKRTLALAAIAALLVSFSGCFLQSSTPSATASEVEEGIFTLVNQERVAEKLAPLTRVAWLDELAQDYAESAFDPAEGTLTDITYLVSNTWLLDFGGGTPSLDEDTAAEQVEYCMDRESLSDALLRQEARETGVGVAIVGSKVYFAQVFDVIYSSGGDGQPIELVENQLAEDPTWDDLVAFLETDLTDEQEYIEDEFICGDYAEMLHNNAETAGYKAAYVAVKLNSEPGHALNAFRIGSYIVYVDMGSGDSIAYLEIGQRYGTIDIQYVDSIGDTTYAFFTSYDDGPGTGYLLSDHDTVVDYCIHW